MVVEWVIMEMVINLKGIHMYAKENTEILYSLYINKNTYHSR